MGTTTGARQDTDALSTLEQRLAESLAQQAATSEILRAISSSPSDIQPVLDTLVRAAARFCHAPDVLILRIDNGTLRGASAIGPFAEVLARGAGSIPALTIPVSRESVSGRAAIERRTVHVHDLAAEPEDEYPIGRQLQRQFGHRTMVATPLLRQGIPVGVIDLFRTVVEPFSDRQLELLRTFADQAVIAIENARLLNELQARNEDLTEALEQQTATSEILRVISRSQTSLQPVFDTIANSALKLCAASSVNVFTYDGELLHVAALVNVDPEYAATTHPLFPRPPSRDIGATRAILQREVVTIPDVLADNE